MLTEEEAKTKVCHVTLGRHINDAGYRQWTNCSGSACMAWRWEKIARLTYRPQEALRGTTNNVGTFWDEPDRPDFINAEWLWDASRGHWYVGKPQGALGVCGLAGAP